MTGTNPGTNLMSMLMPTPGSIVSENFIVADYLTSRQVVEEAQSRIQVIGLYSRPNIDWWARFDAARRLEDFVRYWRHMVTASYDQVTGISTARVRAFTPQDAQLIAETLVTLSEELINRLGMRANTDAVAFAEKELTRAQDRLKGISFKLADYRNRTGVIDPTSSVVASNSGLAQTLRANLAQLETNLDSLLRQRLGRTSPVVQSLQSQIKATQEQLAMLESKVGNKAGGPALSAVVAEYEQLELERQFAMAAVTSATQALDQARATATAQRLYITPYVRPGRPQTPEFPKVFETVMMVALFCFFGWTVLMLLWRSIREHLV